MRKRFLVVALIVAMILSLVGCGKKIDEDAFKVYYVNIDVTNIQPEEYDFSSDGKTLSEQVDEILRVLSKEPDDNKLRRTIKETIDVLGHTENGYTVTVDFSASYNDMTPAEEVLSRAAIVKTLTQISDIMYVNFTVESEPLKNYDDVIVGSMSADTFIENPGEQINTSGEETLTLFFADKEGDGLVKQKRVIHYSSNISLEKLVVEQLIEGPKNAKLQSTLPTGTKLINISVVDGVCYLNFDDTFRNSLNSKLTEEVILYSIVNSLTSLSYVDKVQISINGEDDGVLIYNYKLSSMYEFNEKIVHDINSSSDDKGTDNLEEKDD